jgi:hypothetical protein
MYRNGIHVLSPTGGEDLFSSGKNWLLWEITNGLLYCNGKIKHLGIKAVPKRSTLA